MLSLNNRPRFRTTKQLSTICSHFCRLKRDRLQARDFSKARSGMQASNEIIILPLTVITWLIFHLAVNGQWCFAWRAELNIYVSSCVE